MQTILAIAINLAILATSAGLVCLLRYLRKTDAAAKLKDSIDFCAVIRQLNETLPWLCTQAEKLLGGGTGDVKRSWVIQEIIKLIPDHLRAKLGVTNLDGIYDEISDALKRLRPLWEEYPGLIAPEAELDAGPYLFKAGQDIAKGQEVELQALLLPTEEEPAPKPKRKKRIVGTVEPLPAEEAPEGDGDAGDDGKRSLTFHLNIEVDGGADVPAEEAEEAPAAEEADSE